MTDTKVGLAEFNAIFERLLAMGVIRDPIDKQAVIDTFNTPSIEIAADDKRVTFTPLPLFNPVKNTVLKEGSEFPSVSGVLKIEQRTFTLPYFHLQDFVGVVEHQDGCANFANIENHLAMLNGCEVEVRIKLLKFPINAPRCKPVDDNQLLELEINSWGDADILRTLLDLTRKNLQGKQGVFDYKWQIKERAKRSQPETLDME